MVSYNILRDIGKVDYELACPNELALVPQVYNVSLFQKFDGYATYIFLLEGFGVWRISLMRR